MASDPKNSEVAKADLVSDLQRKLDDANKIIEQREKELAEAQKFAQANQDSLSNRTVRGATDITKGDGYKFEVGLKKPNPGLPNEIVEACDESEAIRWFILTRSHPDRPGLQIDPSLHAVAAKCVDSRRDARIKQAQFISKLRKKSENGGTLTDDEQTLLDAADEKVLNPE